ncbi:CynX/NimT family MFS transporter [soil metagenome]
MAITLAAFNLRPMVTSVGAVLRQLQAGTGMSDPLAGVLTSVPVVAFGVVGLVAGRIARRLGLGWTFVAAMSALVSGLILRVLLPHPATVVAATGLAVAGAALGNVLLPVAVKRWFADRMGWATAVYSVALVLGSAAAAAATVPIAQLAGGWRAGLGAWVLPALAALTAWVLVAGRSVDGHVDRVATDEASVSVHRSRQAWALAVFFGTQSLAAYTAMGWLPTIYTDAGVAPTAAGLYLGLVMLVGVPIAMGLPVLAARRPDQRAVVILVITLTATAYTGLMIAPATLPALWAVLLGAGFGAFPLALTMISLRAATDKGTSQLSSLTQGVGYLIAAGGPVAVGLIHNMTGGWTWPLALLLIVLVPQLFSGLVAAKPGYVDIGDDLRAP